MDLKTVPQVDTAPLKGGTTSTIQILETDGLSCLWRSDETAGISADIADVLLAHINNTTSTSKKCLAFCREGKVNNYTPTINQALTFLKSLQDEGLSYSALNTARSALSTLICLPGCSTFGTHPLVTRFMKGVHETRKPQPKYSHIWDVSTVLKRLATLKANSSLSIEEPIT